MNTLFGAEVASSLSFPPPVGLGLGLAPCLPWVPTECLLPLFPWSRPQPAGCLPLFPCPTCWQEKEHPVPRLSAGEGAGRAGAGLQCARWTRGGSSTLRERRLVTNGIPNRGSSPAGGFPGLPSRRLRRCCRGGQARCPPREGLSPIPSWDQGSPRACPGSILCV